MAAVQSVLGPVAPEQLGATLLHEHLVFGPENSPGWAPLPDRAALARTIADELRDVRAEHGLGCFVDLSAIGCSRDVELGRAVASQSGVAVVLCTGFWEGSSYPDWVNEASIEAIATVITRELEEGINGTGVRAGVIKDATAQPGITRQEANVLRAAARAHLRTGAAIITHTGLGTMMPRGHISAPALPS
jgi:phosphotriesterase-related protein